MSKDLFKLSFWLRNRVNLIRISCGLFGAHFFLFYFLLFDTIQSIRSNTQQGLLNNLISLWPPDSVYFLFKVILVTSFIASICFTLNYRSRLSAAIIWFSYTLFYNFVLCINQPHISYFLFIMITFLFFSASEIHQGLSIKWGSSKIHLLWVPLGLYMCQMSISGFSKLLLPEWRHGEILQIMTIVRDPEPGVLFIGVLPDFILKILTWLVLALECGSVFYLLFSKLRFFIWVSHVILFLTIIALVPHATHVGLIMLIFVIFIFDPNILPRRRQNVSETE